MAALGYENLVNMDGGFHGRMDETGRLVEQGWAACGFETAMTAHPERTWEALQEG